MISHLLPMVENFLELSRISSAMAAYSHYNLVSLPESIGRRESRRRSDEGKIPASGELSLQDSVDLGCQVSDSSVHSQEKRYGNMTRLSKQPNFPNDHLEANRSMCPNKYLPASGLHACVTYKQVLQAYE
jgi:hypothetical protein